MSILAKQIGLVLTPSAVARELVSWAVQMPEEVVLDVGAGEGVFLEETVRRLRELGCTTNQVQRQVFGVERNTELYQAACGKIEASCQVALPSFLNADLFNITFPAISAVVGNPPYVRRNTLDEIDRIRERIIYHNPFLATLPRLSDLYSYFLIYSSQFLRPGGRMAVIVSSSWMDTDYGISLKEFLLRNFKLKMLAVCEARLFGDALVKSVMLFAEKGTHSAADKVRFIRLPEFLAGFTEMGDEELGRVSEVYTVKQGDLDERRPWGIFIRQAKAYFSLPAGKCIPLGTLAKTRIGIQPLARDFYILSSEKAKQLDIPKQYLQPLLSSPKTVTTAMVEAQGNWSHYILFVKEPKDKIKSKALLRYIDAAEKKSVSVRGKDDFVEGYQNLPRLMKTGRSPWYNLVVEIQRRGRYRIMIPRRFYESFLVVWNKAAVVGNENFIEADPKDETNLLALLGILNTSFFELVCRSHAQHYGGGVFNLNPLDVRELPVLNPIMLDPEDRKQIEAAYNKFTASVDRDALDVVVAECFGISKAKVKEIQNAVSDLRLLSVAAKRITCFG